MPQVVITVTKRENDWHAMINQDPAKWGCGPTYDSAVGDVLSTWGEEHGIVVRYQGKQ